MAKCEYVYYDGAGHYCKLAKPINKDYPHKHWRVMCFGEQKSHSCLINKNFPESKKSNLYVLIKGR